MTHVYSLILYNVRVPCVTRSWKVKKQTGTLSSSLEICVWYVHFIEHSLIINKHLRFAKVKNTD